MTTGDDTKLNDNNNDDTMLIEQQEQSTGAGVEITPEDTQNGSSYERVIAVQNATIDTLTKQIESLNGQISTLVRSTGSQASDTTYNPAVDPDTSIGATIPDDYVYLKDLGKEIGKRS